MTSNELRAVFIDMLQGGIDGLHRGLVDEEPPLPPRSVADPPVTRVEGDDKAVMTVDEVAEVLSIGRSSAYAAVASGEIPSIKIGRKVLIPVAALKRLLMPSCIDG